MQESSSTPAQTLAETPAAREPLRGSRTAIAIGAGLVAISVLYGFASFLVMADLTPITPDHGVVFWALLGNGLLAALVLAFVLREAVRLLRARRRGIAGAKLHARIVGLFALASAIPAILMASAASVTLDKGFDSLFSAGTREVYRTSVGLAETYIRETSATLRNDLLQLAFVFNGLGNLLESDKDRFDEVARTQLSLAGLHGVYVIRKDLTIVTKVVAVPDDRFAVPSEEDMRLADEGRPVLKPVNQQREIAGLIKLPDIPDTYLFIARRLDPSIMARLQSTADEALRYNQLEDRRLGMQLALTLMYTAIGLILVFSAIWMGFWLANLLVAPIRRLIGAAKLVSDGDLDVKVPVQASEGELANLGETFNDMTAQLRSQREELVNANIQLDERRQFTEAVLEGVTAGVIGLDRHGIINLVNRSGEAILETSLEQLSGKPLAQEIPEIAPIWAECAERGRRLSEGHITWRGEAGEKTIIVRVTSEGVGAENRGYVVTLDDITELVVAQRTSAWADVARRIAHEIKNPLTPIQLSAERLKRKYGKVIGEGDRQVFDQCTDTIIRQVGDIGRMVDEFSSFARMPKAVMAENDLADILRQSAFLISVSEPSVSFDIQIEESPAPVRCDRRLMSQALTNLIKNATEAFATVEMEEGEAPWIRVSLKRGGEGNGYVIVITDNGCGFPKENRNRLLEPYMTTREKGTGLGLAIVAKIIEEHGGKMSLEDAPQVADGGHGAMVVIDLPAEPPVNGQAAAGDEEQGEDANERVMAEAGQSGPGQ